MQRKFSASRRAYYFVLSFIILLGILAFFLSCKSNSPTESTAALNSQVTDQSANNTTQTTTSSSTTTSVKPGQSPTNTTTLITSRYLTTTSIRTTTTTTTSIPTATTTSTTKPTTTIASANLEWCNFEGSGNQACAIYKDCGDTFTICLGEYRIWLDPQLINNGEAPAHNVWVILKDVIVSSGFPVTVVQDRALFSTIPVDIWCTFGSPSIIIKWNPADASPGDTIKLVFVETYSRSKCTLTIRIP